MGEADRHLVDAGPAWKLKLPPFHVLVHSPLKWTSTLRCVHYLRAVHHLPLPSFVCLAPRLAVTLALAFPTKRMTYEKLLVCVLGSCETMANTSVVCTDKSGTLTQNVMTVVAGSVGICLWTTLRKASARSHQPPPYSPITPSPRNLFSLDLDDKPRFEKLSILALPILHSHSTHLFL
jgi:hypothetical protein